MSGPLDRRAFLSVSAVGGAGLLLGFHLGCRRRSNSTQEASAAAADDAAAEPVTSAEINAYVRIDSDDTVTFLIPQSEMGQGVLTSLAMILAEELKVDWARVRSEHAPADAERYGRQSTGGSTSVRMRYDGLRAAGAAARELFVAAAAQRWEVDAATLRAEAGHVVGPDGARERYGALAALAATLEPPASPQLTAPADFSLIGTRAPRLDLAGKVDGSAVFGIDVKRPQMLVAQLARCPVFGGSLERFDDTAARAVAGVREVVAVPTGVAVVADHYWAARKGRAALEVVWNEGPAAALSSASITATLRKAAAGGAVARDEGDARAALRRASRTVEAVYEVPYLAHTPMEPLNATAEVTDERCEIWAPTQGPTAAVQKAAEITGLSPDKITLHTTLLGGGFGRRSQTDFIADAVHVARAVGKPVKVIWDREDDVRGGWYRPVAYNELRGALDADGWPVAWEHRIASPSILAGLRPLDGVDGTSVEGAANLPYAIEHLRVTCAAPKLPVTLWFWRSVGSSQNAYVTECFLDELAVAGGKDPVELRLRLLAEKPRHRRTLELAAERAGWGGPLPEGVARGVAVHECFGSVVTQVAEVSVDGGAVRVHRVVCAVECGPVINPDTIEAQMESGLVYGLSSLHGEITIEGGRAVQGNFHDYPALRLPEMPRVETHIVDSDGPLGGIGEPGTPPIVPAVCNAVFALTGTPVRKLPIRLG